MKKKFTQQEILLITGSSFFQQQCFEKNEQDNNRNLSQEEKIEEACWNGMLPELLPDIVRKNIDGKELRLWQTILHESFLGIQLCEVPSATDMYYSIDPYLFTKEKIAN